VRDRYVDGMFKVVQQPFKQLFFRVVFVQKTARWSSYLWHLHWCHTVAGWTTSACSMPSSTPCRDVRGSRQLCPTSSSPYGTLSARFCPEWHNADAPFTTGRQIGKTYRQLGFRQCIRHTSDESVGRIRCQTMALPFLPADVATAEFRSTEVSTDHPAMTQHLQYVDRQWISSTV